MKIKIINDNLGMPVEFEGENEQLILEEVARGLTECNWTDEDGNFIIVKAENLMEGVDYEIIVTD